jgi:hypothetical protein
MAMTYSEISSDIRQQAWVAEENEEEYEVDKENTDEWDEKYEDNEDGNEEEDYEDEPPTFVAPPPSSPQAPAFQEPGRYHPAQDQDRLAVLALLEYIEALQDAIGKGGIASFDTGDYDLSEYSASSTLIYLAEILDNALCKKTRARVGAKLIGLSRLEDFVREIDSFLGICNLAAFTNVDAFSLPVLLYDRPGGLLEPLTDKEWQALSDKAVADMLKRRQLADRSGLNEIDTNFTIHREINGFCAYRGSKKRYRFANNEAKHAAEAIVAAEKVRLKLFLEALQGTLRFLDRLTRLPNYSERHIQGYYLRNDWTRNDRHQLAREMASGIISTFQDILNDDPNKQKRLWGDLDELVGRVEVYEEDTEDDEEHEDTDVEEDYYEEPLDSASSPPSPASTPAYQGKEHHQPAQGQSRLGREVQTDPSGRYIAADNYVDVPQASRRQGLYLIGIQGTGKSVLIENLIIQDIKQNMGVCVLDPHGDLINAVLSRLPERRVNDVIYLDISDEDYPFGINLFTCSNPNSAKAVQIIVDKVRHVFEKLLGVSHDTPLLLEYLTNCTRTLIANPGYTMADIPLLLQDGGCRKKLVANVTDIDVQRFWRHHDQKKPADQVYEISSTLRRVGEFLQPLSRNIVGQSTSTIDLQSIMNEGKILLVKLSPELLSVSSLIGSLFIALFLQAAKSRAEVPVNKRRQFNLYADEFQRFATEDMATLLEEARKYAVATTIAHQNRGQLDSNNRQLETNLKDRTRSAANLVVFRINSKDAEELAGEFDITPQAAWEQEVEKESFEPKIDIIDEEVEEDITEITQNPVEYLVSARGTHISEDVRLATQDYLASLVGIKDRVVGQRAEWEKQLLNNLLVSVMEGWVEIGTDEFIQQVIKIMSVHFDDFTKYFYSGDSRQWKNYAREFIRSFILGKIPNIAQEIKKIRKEVEIIEVKKHLENPRGIRPEDKVTDEEIRLRGWDQIMEEWVQGIKAFRYLDIDGSGKWAEQQAFQCVDLLSNLLELCAELAKNPIRVPTGEKRLVLKKRTHLTYLTHPRKTIMHPQRTYADVLNEVASQLTNLKVFTARVKITTDNGIEEHMIRTLDPKLDQDKPLFGQALQERIARIQTHNRTPLSLGSLPYCRSRQEIEAEIRERQAQCSKSSEPPEAEPPISRHPQR